MNNRQGMLIETPVPKDTNGYSKILFVVTLLAVALLCGCEAMNDTLVRQWFIDRGLSSEISSQIREGYQRRMASPPVQGPMRPAPQFLDQG